MKILILHKANYSDVKVFLNVPSPSASKLRRNQWNGPFDIMLKLLTEMVRVNRP